MSKRKANPLAQALVFLVMSPVYVIYALLHIAVWPILAVLWLVFVLPINLMDRRKARRESNRR